MIKVESSNIAEISYKTKDSVLFVKFKNGTVYSYTGVPAAEFINLLQAESVGKYFNAEIKSVYPYQKEDVNVEEGKPSE